MCRVNPPLGDQLGEPLIRLRSLLDELTGAEQTAVLTFLTDPSARRIALADAAAQQAQAVNDWLNVHELAGPAADAGTEGRCPAADGLSRSVGRSVPLPAAPAPGQMSLADALHGRRSRYVYSACPLRLASLSALLRHSVGVGRRVHGHGRPDHPLSLAPSAGGLNSVAVYVVACDVEEVPPGIYRYQPEPHALAELAVGDPRPALAQVYAQPEFATRCAVTLVLAARLTHTMRKYSLRHYRTVHIDTGIAAQNFSLVATALDLACCPVSGYLDTKINELLGLGEQQITTLLMPVGHRPHPGQVPARSRR